MGFPLDVFGDGRLGGCGKISPLAFPYLCSDGSRTLRLLRADIVFGFDCWRVLVNVRPAQTECARTAGHRILEKPEGLFAAAARLVVGWVIYGLGIVEKYINVWLQVGEK